FGRPFGKGARKVGCQEPAEIGRVEPAGFEAVRGLGRGERMIAKASAPRDPQSDYQACQNDRPTIQVGLNQFQSAPHCKTYSITVFSLFAGTMGYSWLSISSTGS